MRIVVTGAEWDGASEVMAKTSIIDFIDKNDESQWIELDFMSHEIHYPNLGNSNFPLAGVFYPEQDARYKCRQPQILEIMKSTFRVLQPLLVAQDEHDEISKLFLGLASVPPDTSFLVIDVRLLPSESAKTLLANPDLHTLQWLTEHVVWINGPLGLGDETDHVQDRSTGLRTNAQGMTLTDQDFAELQAAREKHQEALSAILHAIQWDHLRLMMNARDLNR
ncbi:hypothetical protein [Deinococcus radiotolerans]|nr:hypothetical protein [Deinococcus radiotolerans]